MDKSRNTVILSVVHHRQNPQIINSTLTFNYEENTVHHALAFKIKKSAQSIKRNIIDGMYFHPHGSILCWALGFHYTVQITF
jgi:hypothetical protein